MQHNVLPHRRPRPTGPQIADLSDEGRMLAFAVRWHPYGGGPAEDIRVEFGLSVDEFYRRVAVALDGDHSAAKLDRRVIASIREVCRRRVWLGE